jgi:hypothetical protein
VPALEQVALGLRRVLGVRKVRNIRNIRNIRLDVVVPVWL